MRGVDRYARGKTPKTTKRRCSRVLRRATSTPSLREMCDAHTPVQSLVRIVSHLNMAYLLSILSSLETVGAADSFAQLSFVRPDEIYRRAVQVGDTTIRG